MTSPLSLDHPSSFGEAAFARVIAELRALAPRMLVEFGSGVSTVRLAQALPETEILSIEDSPDYYARSQALLHQHAPGARVRIDLRPLTWQLHAGALYLSYRPGPMPEQIDAAIIDGPPGWTRRGREACLHLIAPRLRPGARVYLDDYGRPGERRIARNWQRAWPGELTLRELAVDHGVAVLEVGHSLSRARPDVRTMADCAFQSADRIARESRVRVLKAFGLRRP